MDRGDGDDGQHCGREPVHATIAKQAGGGRRRPGCRLSGRSVHGDVLGDAQRGAAAAGEARNRGGGGQSDEVAVDEESELVDDVVLFSLLDELELSALLSDDESVLPVLAPLSLEAPEPERLSVL